MQSNYITCEIFKKRMVDLFLRSGLTDFPSKRGDQLMILKSIAILFDENQVYPEAEVNEKIKLWLIKINPFPGWDFVTLRRRLVDESFLNRNRDGSGYRICSSGPAGVTFDPAIAKLDVNEVICEGQKFIAQKKTEYLQKHSD